MSSIRLAASWTDFGRGEEQWKKSVALVYGVRKFLKQRYFYFLECFCRIASSLETRDWLCIVELISYLARILFSVRLLFYIAFRLLPCIGTCLKFWWSWNPKDYVKLHDTLRVYAILIRYAFTRVNIRRWIFTNRTIVGDVEEISRSRKKENDTLIDRGDWVKGMVLTGRKKEGI